MFDSVCDSARLENVDVETWRATAAGIKIE